MKIRLFLSCFLLLFSVTLTGQLNEHILKQNQSQELFVTNRVLFQVNDKSITVLDLQKKMDMVLFKHFPQYAHSPTHRFQFYSANWFDVFMQTIDRELVIADAKEKNLLVTDSEIREQLQVFFGTNYLEVIDQLNLTSEDAWKMAEEELIVERMMMYSVKIKARDSISPDMVAKSCKEYLTNQNGNRKFSYKIATFSNPEPSLSKKNSDSAYQLLTASKTTFDDLLTTLKKESLLDANTELTLSDTYQEKESDLSKTYFSAIKDLKSGSYSLPQEQVSRNSQKSVSRIFHLIEVKEPKIDSAEVVENQVREKLLQVAIEKKTKAYIEKLRKHFHITDKEIQRTISSTFKPFSLN